MLGWQYMDSWVENRVVFQYVAGGGCQCCGLSLMQANVMQLMAACTDVESSNEDQDEHSKWPPAVRESVWKDRVRVRIALKRNSARYARMWRDHGDALSAFWRQLSVAQKRRIFQVPSSELHRVIVEDYKLEEAYRAVLIAVAQQVEHFELTGYPVDGNTDAERQLETALKVTRGTFVVAEEYLEDTSEESGFLKRLQETGQRSLLSNKNTSMAYDVPPEVADAEDALAKVETVKAKLAEVEAEEADQQEEQVAEAPSTPQASGPKLKTQSFRGDRRIIRLIIFRQFADAFLHAFERDVQQQQ